MDNEDTSSKNNLNPQDQLNYKNKAKNLEFVKNNSNIKIPYFKEIIFDFLLKIKELASINLKFFFFLRICSAFFSKLFVAVVAEKFFILFLSTPYLQL